MKFGIQNFYFIRTFSSSSVRLKLFRFVKPDSPQWKRIDEAKLEMDQIDSKEIRRPFNYCKSLEGLDENVKKLLTLEYGKKVDAFEIFKDQTLSKVQNHVNDYTSMEAQIGLLTARIRKGMEHLKTNPHDKFCRFTLHKKIDARRRLLNHLRCYNEESYDRVCQALGITWQEYPYPPLETHFNKAIREAREKAEDLMEIKLREYKEGLTLKKEEFYERKERILAELDEMERGVVLA